MARPKTPPPLAVAFDLDAWEAQPELLQLAREEAAKPLLQAILTVLTNERPTAKGVTNSIEFANGYENCLGLLRFLLTGRAREAVREAGEPTYASDEVEQELKWKR